MSRFQGIGDVVVLVLIALFSGLALSGVYLGTKEPIAMAKQRELELALKRVCPFMESDYREIEFQSRNASGETVKIPVYAVYREHVLEGAALKLVSHEGFSGEIVFLLGVSKNGQMTGLYILSHKETPGLGTKAADKSWWGQFAGQSLDTMNFKVKKDGGDTDAITAATITSRAVSGGIEQGLVIYREFAASEVSHGN
ncbi:MAG: RnfABCDGE type electron transport complex subunit G [Holophagae bacterium]|nr:RnfABCDGE type electron transport complex subunit G [Holophagae bacterium]